MSASQRRKGQVGEREAAALLTDEFGTLCKRTLDQPREGGCDIASLPGFSIEVKRRKKLGLHAWMKQAREGAGTSIPLVMCRGDGQEWLVVVPFKAAAKWMRDELPPT
jgi:O-succinylbenzoate synthase